MKDLVEVLMHPIRTRIVQHLLVHPTATAGVLAEFMYDVARTTLYRHLNVLLEHDILTVVEETRIRGSVERTYSLNHQGLSSADDAQGMSRMAYSFLMNLFVDLDTYFKQENNDPNADKVFFRNCQLLLSDEEYDQFLHDLGTLLSKNLNNPPSPERRQRSLSIVSTPGDVRRDGS